MNIIIRGKNEHKQRQLSDKDMCKYFGHLEDHQYKGYNNALGCYVKGKEHFKKLLQDGNYVPFELGEKMAQEQRRNTIKPYDDVAEKTKKAIYGLKETATKDGKLKYPEQTKKACESVGVKFDPFYDKLPDHYKNVPINEGGFK